MNVQNAEFMASYGLSSQLPLSDRAEVIFSGRSNVGKSSLINKLCMRKSIARVSSTPGKTATINYYNVDNVYFVDLPGYGYAKVSQDERARWDELINYYFEGFRRRAVVIQLLDSRHNPSQDDLSMLEYIRHYELPCIVALTKCDKLKKSQYDTTIEQFSNICKQFGCKQIYLTSAENNINIDLLRLAIDEYIAEE
ncbi:MAG: ribosome biogenesis GTP-binding protein YihA/YsxC [Oscillospiraceae bacterium]